jgi:hypothetical protein
VEPVDQGLGRLAGRAHNTDTIAPFQYVRQPATFSGAPRSRIRA